MYILYDKGLHIPVIIDNNIYLLISFILSYLLSKNIFCLRVNGMLNSYRRISINNLELRAPKLALHERIQLRIVPDKESGLFKVRF